MDNAKTAFMTIFPSSPAFYFAVESPSKTTILTSIVLPMVFFLISKAVDVALKFHFERKKKA